MLFVQLLKYKKEKNLIMYLGKKITILSDRQRAEVIWIFTYDMQENEPRKTTLKPESGVPREFVH